MEGKQYWRIYVNRCNAARDYNGNIIKQCHKDGGIYIGGGKAGDLTHYLPANKIEFEEKLIPVMKENYLQNYRKVSGKLKNHIRILYIFCKRMKAGDVILMTSRQQQSSFFYVGTISGDYAYCEKYADTEMSDYRHFREVKWEPELLMPEDTGKDLWQDLKDGDKGWILCFDTVNKYAAELEPLIAQLS